MCMQQAALPCMDVQSDCQPQQQHKAVKDACTGATQHICPVLAVTSALTPQNSMLSTGPLHNTTPRSREEIRKLFTRRSMPLPAATSSSNLHNAAQLPSRLQNHSNTALPEAAQPGAGLCQQQPLPAEPSNSVTSSLHLVPAQTSSCPAQGFHAPPVFGQYAYPGNTLPAGSSLQQKHSSAQSEQRPQRASGSSQNASGTAARSQKEASAAPRTSVSSGPAMRAEILMGAAATIEVNVRYHANIAAALKGYVPRATSVKV